jgi:predicted N-acetyltransferase YhbS
MEETAAADGPRALREGEWDELNAVVSAVFRPEMFRDYPQLFAPANREHLRVVAADGEVVCHVGFTERPATLAGCRIDVASIGAVATLDAYRGRGYASAAFQDACDVAAADGVDVMLISGGRGLYTRVGCRPVGQDWTFRLTPETAPGLAGAPGVAGGAAFALTPVGPERIDALRALYQREPVRFLRPRADWEMAFSCRVVMNTASDFWSVSDGETVLAYLIVHQPDKVRRRHPDEPAQVRVVEFAGERTLVAAALPRLLAHYGAGALTVHVQGSDPALRALLTAGGLSGEPDSASGTLRVINFPQLMERCRPYLAERIGADVAAGLVFEADAPPGSAGGGFTVRRGAESVRLADLASLAVYLFGSPELTSVAPEGSPDLAATLAQALPLPALWYGINYV